MTEGEHVRPGHESRSEGLATMTFGEHLEELRRRLLISVITVVAVMFFFLFQKTAVMHFITGPYQAMWVQRYGDWYEDSFAKIDQAELAKLGQSYVSDYQLIEKHQNEIRDWDWDSIAGGAVDIPQALSRFRFKLKPGLISTTPLQDFVTFMIAAALCGLAVASPVVLHQMWRFIAAGLYKRERRIVMSFVPASVLLFVSGMTFGFLVMVPTALFFLTGIADSEVLLTVQDYFRFLFILTIALGFVFQLPVLMVGLTKAGITTPSFYLKYWRHVILLIFFLGAVFTPPDPVTQVLMATPMLVLFFIGLALSKLVYKKKQEKKQGQGA